MEDWQQMSDEELLRRTNPDIFSIVKAIGKDIIPRCQIIPDMGLKGRRSWRIHHFNPAREDGFVEMTKPDHPNSPSQMYRLTEKGLRLLAALNRRAILKLREDPSRDPERPSNGMEGAASA